MAVGLPANQDFRGSHGPDSYGISVWVSAKPAAATSNSAAGRKLSATFHLRTVRVKAAPFEMRTADNHHSLEEF